MLEVTFFKYSPSSVTQTTLEVFKDDVDYFSEREVQTFCSENERGRFTIWADCDPKKLTVSYSVPEDQNSFDAYHELRKLFEAEVHS